MNIQSGRNPARRTPKTALPGGSPMNKVKPVLFIIFMIIMVACVCELHIYFKSGISSLALEIDVTKSNIESTNREIVSLRNKIEKRKSWAYIRQQIKHFGLQMKRPVPGQMHVVRMLPEKTIRLAADAMREHEQRRTAMDQTAAKRKIRVR